MFLSQIHEFCVFKRTVLGRIRRGRHFFPGGGTSWCVMVLFWGTHRAVSNFRYLLTFTGDEQEVRRMPALQFRVFRKLIRSVVKDVILILYLGNLFSQEYGKHITISSDIFTLDIFVDLWSIHFAQPAGIERHWIRLHGGCRVIADPRHAAPAGQSEDSYGAWIWLSEVPGFSVREGDQRNQTVYPLVN